MHGISKRSIASAKRPKQTTMTSWYKTTTKSVPDMAKADPPPHKLVKICRCKLTCTCASLVKSTYADKPGLAVDFYRGFIEPNKAHALCKQLKNTVIDCKAKSGKPATTGKRMGVSFGDTGMTYTLEIRGTTTLRRVIPWDQCPGLVEIRDQVTKLTGQVYNYCVVQVYSTGNVGMKPHKDREMKSGTTIAGVSLGETREFKLTRHGQDDVSLQLENGSLYVLNPPTNDEWMHEVCTNSNQGKCRVSLTFRNVEPARKEEQ